mmetsp:Transcript_2854/g.9371  ORF Transcript_2854/g.9371 Transcript_2854/m.9371 type:complete len:222 (-) Transcript_2854:159-824(-)
MRDEEAKRRRRRGVAAYACAKAKGSVSRIQPATSSACKARCASGTSTAHAAASALTLRTPSIAPSSRRTVRSQVLAVGASGLANSAGTRCSATFGGGGLGGGGSSSLIVCPESSASVQPPSCRSPCSSAGRMWPSFPRDAHVDSSLSRRSRAVRCSHARRSTVPYLLAQSSPPPPPLPSAPAVGRRTRASENKSALRSYCAPSRQTGQQRTERLASRSTSS